MEKTAICFHFSYKYYVSNISCVIYRAQNGHEKEQIIEEQKRIIENLKAQVTSKDRRIQQLEDQIKLFSTPLKSESIA